MAVPKKRTTKSRRDKRRHNIFLKKPALAKCKKCGKLILSHTLCSFCGYYKGREIVDVLAKLTKQEKKKRKKEMKIKEEKGSSTVGGEKRKKPLTLQELSRKK